MVAWSTIDCIVHPQLVCWVSMQEGNSAWLLACAAGHTDVARWLLSEGDIDTRSEQNSFGSTALVLASCSGDIDMVRWLVTEAGSDAHSERNNVCTLVPLRACGRSRAASTVMMTVCGRVQTGFTALLGACFNGRLDAAQWLVCNAGSDVMSEADHVRRFRRDIGVSQWLVCEVVRVVSTAVAVCRTVVHLCFWRAPAVIWTLRGGS